MAESSLKVTLIELLPVSKRLATLLVNPGVIAFPVESAIPSVRFTNVGATFTGPEQVKAPLVEMVPEQTVVPSWEMDRTAPEKMPICEVESSVLSHFAQLKSCTGNLKVTNWGGPAGAKVRVTLSKIV